MAEDKTPVEREIIVATEPSPAAAQKSLGRPMLMLLVLIAAAILGIVGMVLMRSN